jgi:hypothetical protein
MAERLTTDTPRFCNVFLHVDGVGMANALRAQAAECPSSRYLAVGAAFFAKLDGVIRRSRSSAIFLVNTDGRGTHEVR